MGDYVVERVLGKGSMACVYLARDVDTGRLVALKVLRRDAVMSDPVARLLREARAVLAFDHPNAVQLLDFGEVHGRPFLVMEYVEGRSLEEIGARGAPLETRVKWLADAARALAAAHARGIVHRDVKPENVLVRADGVVKVCDFGLARGGEDDQVGLVTLTETGVVVGTPLFMAPEQMRGEPLDGRADQFAWGVTAYWTITGELPWTAHGGTKLLGEIASNAPAPKLAGRAGVPARVAAAVDRALSKDAAARFASMDDVVAALDPPKGVARRLAWGAIVAVAVAVGLAVLIASR